MKKFAFVLIACALITSCGGGSSSSGSSSSPTPSTTGITVGGTVTGLSGSVILQNNGGDTITVTGNGTFTFPTALASGKQYAVSTTTTSPNYYACSITNGTGTVASSNVTNVAVSCSLVPQVAMACGNATSIGSGNVAPLVIDGFPCAAGGTAGGANNANVPYVSVKICAPGSTTNCQIIDHVIVDTGSAGLRIASTALASNLQPGSGLPTVAGRNAATSLAECETYVASYVYGPVVSADVYIAGKLVKNTNMQVFGAPGYQVPAACSNQGGTETDTTQAFNGNGLIGVSFDLLDNYAMYFDCQNSALGQCTSNTSYAGLPNIVSQFSSDNNGVVLALPSVPSTGLSTPTVGTLTFGVSTQANNTPAVSTLAIINDNLGEFAAKVGNTWYSAYIDSGTDLMYFNDNTNTNLTLCSSKGVNAGLYCPAQPQNIPVSFANYASAGKTPVAIGAMTYQVANADVINTPSAIVFSNVAGPIAGSTTLSATTMAFGLSSFYGHNMYFLFNSMSAPGTGLGGTASTTVTGPINGIQ